MRPYLVIAFLLSVGLVGPACAPAPEPPPAAEAPTHAADLAALEANAAAYEAAYAAGDADALAALHADDAVRMPPNAAPVIGKEAIRASFQATFEQFDGNITLSLAEVEVAGDWA